MTTPAGRPDPDAFLAPGGVFIPARLARVVLDELMPPMAELQRRRRLHPDVLALLQALGRAESDAAVPTLEQPASGPWVSAGEAGDEVGMTARHVRRLAGAGQIAARRHGERDWSIDLASLHRWCSRDEVR